MTAPNKTERMQQVAEAVLNLTGSPLYAYRTENNYQAVIGEGSLDARIMFIGEAPGEKEAEAGRPFVGAAGRVLNELLEAIGVAREDVYITNIVKDRPPGNRDPHADELALYAPFLVEQIDIIRPRVIATLGRFSMDFILELLGSPAYGGKISKLHGQALKGRAPYGEVTIVPLYHPAAAFYRQELREQMERDFETIREYVE